MDTKNRIAHMDHAPGQNPATLETGGPYSAGPQVGQTVRSGLKTVDNSIETANITKRSFDELVKSVATLAGQIAKIPTVN